MKVLLLSDPSSSHTIKWANSLSGKGLEIYLFGFSGYNEELFRKDIKIETLNTSQRIKNRKDGSILKIIYLLALSRIKKIIKDFKPDILHAHYASSFGLIGAMTNFHPFIISVWGSDIYTFPMKSIIHKKIIEYSLSKADKILSTSKSMVHQTKKFTNKEIEVTPFGIDAEKFKPMKVDSIFDSNCFVIGTIKTLEKKYGIEYLVKAFKLVKDKLPSIPLKLLIVGGGSLENHLKKVVMELKLGNDTVFTGYIIPDEIPKYLNMLDIYVSLSTEESESFGVAILEASACEKPVVVSRVGGLPEVVKENVTGFIVEKENIQETADVLLKLMINKNLREQMGKAGRERVKKLFDWNKNLEEMISSYNEFLSGR